MPISFISSTFSTVANVKPHKAEAAQRIRTNSLCLVAVLLLSYLLPLPSLPTALKTMVSSSHHQRWSAEWFWDCICLLETALVTLLAYNILEASYAIKYPRAPLPPLVSPLKPKLSVASTPHQPFKVLSPKTSPQVQKPFAFSPKVSTRALSSSSPAYNKSTYAPSPADTPSRVLNYGPIPPSSSTNTQASSISDFLQTPSPVISAYRGKHSGADVGHALDASYLSRILPEFEDED